MPSLLDSAADDPDTIKIAIRIATTIRGQNASKSPTNCS